MLDELKATQKKLHEMGMTAADINLLSSAIIRGYPASDALHVAQFARQNEMTVSEALSIVESTLFKRFRLAEEMRGIVGEFKGAVRDSLSASYFSRQLTWLFERIGVL